MGLIENLMMGGARRRRKSRKLRGGLKNPPLVEHAGLVGGKRSRKKRSSRKRTKGRSCKKGGNGLVPLGLLGALLAVGPKKHRGSKRRGSKRRGSKRRGSKRRSR